MRFNQALKAFKLRDYNIVISLLSVDDEVLNQEEISLKAETFQKLKRYEEAMNVWNLAISNFGDQADFYSERGVCKFHLRFKSSMSDLNRAIELDPENGYRYACRAYVKDKIGDTEGAVVDYTRANELDPDNDITLNNLGLAEEKLGYNQLARSRFKDADSIAGIAHITDKYFKEPRIHKIQENKTMVGELRKMLSSTDEFKLFWNDALKLFRLKK